MARRREAPLEAETTAAQTVENAVMLTRLFLLFALLGFVAGAARSQSLEELKVALHPDLQEFWTRFEPEKNKDDDDGMDSVVRRYEKDAVDTLDSLLEAMGRVEHPGLNGHARALAWSIDRVTRGERYIERVRFVLDLELRSRGRRRVAFANYYKGIDAGDAAIASNSAEEFDAALAQLDRVVAEFELLEDWESAMRVSMHGAFVTQRRGLDFRWERTAWYRRAVQNGEKLPYRDPLAFTAQAALDALIAAGFDPDKDKPALGTGGDVDPDGGGYRDGRAPPEAGEPGGPGRTATLTSFAPGSKDTVVELKRKSNKKGLSGLILPTFDLPDQELVWTKTQLSGDGPEPFDNIRGDAVSYRPFDQRWTLRRDGISQFGIDVDGDDKVDVEFTGTTTPTFIEVPGPEKGLTTPLRVCVPGNAEQMLGLRVNFAPTPDLAQVRFQPAGWLEGKVEGEKVRLFDLNMDGKWGGPIVRWDDLVTRYTDDDHVSWYDVDAMEVGRMKAIAPLSSVTQIKGKWYRLVVDSAKATISSRELAIPTGKVVVDYDIANLPTHVVVREVGEKLEGAVFNIMSAKKKAPVELPVGTYQIISGVLTKGKKTSTDLARIYTGKSPTFEIKAGETTELELGAPFDLVFSHEQQGKERVLRASTIRVFGRFGEEYAMLFDVPLKPEVSVRRVGGSSMAKGEAMRWPGNDEYQTSSNPWQTIHFPVDFRIDNPGRDAVEMMAEQDKHPLLGGPFKSAWIQ